MVSVTVEWGAHGINMTYGYDLKVLRTKGQDIGPTIEPQGVRGKDPILTVTHLETVVGREPGRDR